MEAEAEAPAEVDAEAELGVSTLGDRVGSLLLRMYFVKVLWKVLGAFRVYGRGALG